VSTSSSYFIMPATMMPVLRIAVTSVSRTIYCLSLCLSCPAVL
jgi:hypothetical protein